MRIIAQKIKIKKIEKNNEDMKKMLSTKNEEISRLKNYNQDLEDKIKRSKNNEESSYRSDNDLEEEIKRLNQLILDKDDELVQIQRNLKIQE